MVQEYIKKSHKKSLNERKEFYVFTETPVMIKDKISSEDVSIINVIEDIEDSIPKKFFNNIDMIIVGMFPELEDRDRRAAFMDGAIYVTNNQPSSEQMFEDIVHEIAHSVEEEYTQEIYYDGLVEKEFLGKKKRFLDLLSSNNIKVPNRLRVGSEYSREYDDFLFYVVGYESLISYVRGLFVDPYSSVSLSEYFAVSFEKYYISDEQKYLKNTCPIVYSKIENIHNGGKVDEI